MNGLALPAPAKLNLGLRVVGRRADGRHLLVTLFHAIDLCDELIAAPATGAPAAPALAGPRLAVRADDPRDLVPADDGNLVLAAARAFAAAAGRPLPLRFALHKRIPHGAGLGGGSSDAAAALRLCNQLAPAPLPAARLEELARGLGADVAFFLRGGSQWGTGVGDVLAPARDVPPRHFVLIVPPFGCPTGEVYKNHAAHWKPSLAADSIPGARDGHHQDSEVSDVSHVSGARGGSAGEGSEQDPFANDLAASAERVRPELRRLRTRVAELGVAAHLTGSGSTLFAEAADEGAAAGLAARLAPLGSDGVRLLRARSLAVLPEARAAVLPAWGLPAWGAPGRPLPEGGE